MTHITLAQSAFRKQRARVPSLPDGWHFNDGVDLEDVWAASGFELGTGSKHISQATFCPARVRQPCTLLGLFTEVIWNPVVKAKYLKIGNFY
jgi:hypothetical protein